MFKKTNQSWTGVPPELVANYSVFTACQSAHFSTADIPILSHEQKLSLLEEIIAFHHFIALEVMTIAIKDDDSRRAFTERLMNSLKAGEYRHNIIMFTQFSIQEQEVAIQRSLLGVANIRGCMLQDLYLGERPNAREREVMTHFLPNKTFDSRGLSNERLVYLGAALFARLIISSGVTIPSYAALELMSLAAAHSKPAYLMYLELFGFKITGED